MSQKDERYLVTSPIRKALMGLALPIMATSFFATAYNVTDMLWIGRLGSAAVAGVGSGGMYLWFSEGIVMIARMGGQVYAAQALGAGDKEKAGRYGKAAFLFALAMALVVGLICVTFAHPLLGLFGIEDAQTRLYGVKYLRITGGLILFYFMDQVLIGLFTARGDSKTPLYANMAGLITNIVLDPILVLGLGPAPKMGVVGAAVATITAQALSFVVFLFHLRKIKIFAKGRVGANVYADILRMGFPAGVQKSLYCFFSMVLTRFTAVFGPEAIAVSRLGGNIESLSWNIADGFGSAMNAFAGQNYGAHKFDRIRKGYKLSFVAVLGWGLLITGLFVGFPNQIAHMFFFEEKAIAAMISYLLIVGLSESLMSVEIMAGGSLSGLGATKVFSIISIILTGMRIPLAYVLPKVLGLNGIWWAFTSTSWMKGIVLHIAFMIVLAKKERRVH